MISMQKTPTLLLFLRKDKGPLFEMHSAPFEYTYAGTEIFNIQTVHPSIV